MRVKKSPNKFGQFEENASMNANRGNSKQPASKIRLVEMLELDEIQSENEVEEKAC